MQKLSLLQGFTQMDLPLPENGSDSTTHLKESYLAIQMQPDNEI